MFSIEMLQALLSLCIAMSFFYIGLVRGYSAPAVPSIMENDPELLPTKNIASWASTWFFFHNFLNIFVEKCVSSFRFSIDFMLFKGSVPPSGAFFGSILAAASLHYLGRKYTIIIASPLATIGWILIATATRYEVVIAARFLNGFCVGLCLPSAQVYVSFF